MARVDVLRCDRGAVYVEFLIAFFPIFLIFLALCQLGLIGAAEAVVRHSAFSAVRAAIVVLEESPDDFDGAPRGNLSAGRTDGIKNVDDVLKKLDVTTSEKAATSDKHATQQGARMVPITAAAYLPLLPVAPSEQMSRGAADTIDHSIVSADERQLGFAIEYTKVATKISVHDAPDNQSLAIEPIGLKAPVSVRVRYFFHCTVPVVRTMICRSLTALGKNPLIKVPAELGSMLGQDAHFKLLTATATLPNQGAAYYGAESGS
jgi:hypothetical protein